MATREEKGASGTVVLYSKFYESGSGHKETSSSAKLIAKDENTIILEQRSRSIDYYNLSKESENVERFQISVSNLIKAIKDSGNKL